MNGYYSFEYEISLDMLEEYWRWRVGLPEPIWITQLGIVEETIRKQRLTPLAREHYPSIGFSQPAPMAGKRIARMSQSEQKRGEELILKKDFPGGLRCPHLHHKRDIYLLNDEQWKNFSDRIIAGFKDKLSKIGTINFEQIIRTSQVMDTMT